MTKQLTVGILIFADVEVLDFCGPFEVFSSARRLATSDDDTQVFDVLTIAEQHGTISCRGGLLVQPHHAFDDHPPLDILIVPGGRGTRALTDHRATLD
jgi:putative intracellular protease/amidase